MELTQAYLKECFDYDPVTGNLIWRARPRSHFNTVGNFYNQKSLVGKRAGADSLGYTQIKLCGTAYKAHRLIWLHVYGKWPDHELDHINRDKSDNRLCNLRECSDSQNAHAGSARKNKYGLRGVFRVRRKWGASITVAGVTESLGASFATAREAAIAYALASVDRLGAFAPIEAKQLFNEAYP